MHLLREMKYTLKMLARDTGFIFWTLFYPIIMAIFFYLAFGNLLEGRDVRVSVGLSAQNEWNRMLKQVDVFDIKTVEPEEMTEALKNKEISSYVTDEGDLIVAQSGIGQTITQGTLRLFKQMFYIFGNGGNLNSIDFKTDYLNIHTTQVSTMGMIFYSLLAMISFYGFFGGINIMSSYQADVSELGKRMSVSPIRKGGYIFSNAVLITFVNIVSNIMVIVFIAFVLKINLFTDYRSSLALIAAGNIWGVSLGILIGSSKLKEGIKTAIGIAVPLALSALAGMMSTQVKMEIMWNLPWLDRVNPASIITSGLYRVNLLGQDPFFLQGMMILLGMSILFVVLAVRQVGRKSYDNF